MISQVGLEQLKTQFNKLITFTIEAGQTCTASLF